MKSKKLFAILTLVAFMMTLAPMAALADIVDRTAGDGQSVYFGDESTLSATGVNVDDYFDDASAGSIKATAAKFTVTFKDAGGALSAGELVDFYIKTSKSSAKVWVDRDADDTLDAATELIEGADAVEMASSDGFGFNNVELTTGGKVIFYVGSEVATSFTVEVYDSIGTDGQRIGSAKTVNVESEDDSLVVTAYEDDDDAAGQITTDAYGTFPNGYPAGEGFDVRAELANGDEDETVTFKQRINAGSWTTIGTDETDDDGIASIWVEAEASGTYEFKATCGSETSEVFSMKVASSDPDDIVLKTAAGKIALDKSKTVEVYVKDAAGNLVKDTNESADGDIVAYEFTAVPDGSEYEDEEGAMGTNNRGIAKFPFTPDEVGSYTVKFTLEDTTLYDSGRDTETITFECVDQGTITDMSFDLKNLSGGDVVPAIRYIEDDSEDPVAIARAAVSILDADGTKVTADVADIDFASSNPSAVSVNSDGELTVKDDDFRGTVTITASYEDDAVVGSTEVTVAGAPTSFKVVPTVEGKVATVKIQLVDADGNATVSTSGDFVTKEAVKVLAPTDVTVSGIGKLDHAGAGYFTLTADEYGEYNVTVTSTVDRLAQAELNYAPTQFVDTTRTVTTTFSVDFEMPDSEKPVVGAKVVTMFIGAPGYTQDGVAKVTDVAPFIQDSRTFVAVRPVADAFGAEIGWNEATQTVTLTRSDMTVTIVIGSSAITVVEDGVTTTVNADVAAFIKDGRTVLPFRAVGEAFGATVDYDAATQAVTYEQ